MTESKRQLGKLNSLKSTLRKLQDQLGSDQPNEPASPQREVDRLQRHIRSLEEELRKVEHSREQFDHAFRQNEKLIQALQEA